MNQTNSYFHTLAQNLQINKVILKDAPCYKKDQFGFGPLIKFVDDSVKYDLSSNFNFDPLGYNFPKLLKIRMIPSYLILNDSEEMSSVLQRIAAIYSHNYFLVSNDSDQISLSDNITAYNGLKLSKMPSEKPLDSAKVYSFLAISEFLNEFFYNEETNLPKVNRRLETHFPPEKRIHSFCYDIGTLSHSELDRLNQLGLYIDGPKIFFPLSLSIEDLDYILGIISK